MKRLVFILILTLIPWEASLAARRKGCRQRLAEPITPLKGNGSHFILPKNTRRVFIGVLVHTNRDQWILATAGARFLHSHIHLVLDGLQKEGTISKFEYEQLGEIALVNEESVREIGEAEVATEISGFYDKTIRSLAGNHNRVNVLRDQLEKYLPQLIRKKTRWMDFEESVKRQQSYLLPGADILSQKLSGMLEREHRSSEFRHVVKTWITILSSKMQTLLDETTRPSAEARIRDIVNEFDSHHGIETLEFLLTTLRNDGLEHPAITSMHRAMCSMKKGPWTLEQWLALASLTDRFTDFLLENTSATAAK